MRLAGIVACQLLQRRSKHTAAEETAWRQRCSLALALICSIVPSVIAQDSESPLERVRGVYVEYSTGESVQLEWYSEVKSYHLTVPYDATKVAVRVAIVQGESALEPAPDLSFAVPLSLSLNSSQPLAPGNASEFVVIGLDTPTMMQLTIAGSDYRIQLVRSSIDSSGRPSGPDPARMHPPQGTLSGLEVWDSLGRPAQMASFVPRRSFYRASLGRESHDIQFAATSNDPAAELTVRIDGGKWDYVVSGLSSEPTAINEYGFTLLEVRVRSLAAEQFNTGVLEPLIYQILLTKDPVCHDKCRSCYGTGPDECLSCYAPLVPNGGRCLYTVCTKEGVYYDTILEKCAPCDASCLTCEGAGAWKCTSCEDGQFLITPSTLDVAGRCGMACPIGYFVQPTSLRCRRASGKEANASRVYMQLALRSTLDDFLDDPRLVNEILRVSALALRVSPQDVLFIKWEADPMTEGISYYFGVDNPFVSNDVDIKIDDWFARLPVPVDEVRVLTYTQVYTNQKLEEAVIMRLWMWVVIAASVVTSLILYPLHRLYFIRQYFRVSRYKARLNKKQDFIRTILDQAPSSALQKVNLEAVERK